MRIWQLSAPRNETFAWYQGHAQWVAVDNWDALCPQCGAPPRSVRLPGLTIQWQPGSDRLGDFAWDISGSWPIAQTRVLDELMAHFRGFEASPLTMTQDPKLKRPRRPGKRSKPRIWLPYTGPELRELWVTKIVHFYSPKTSAAILQQCDACGVTRWELRGNERRDWHWDPVARKMLWVRIPRTPNQGLYVRAVDLNGCDFFAVQEFPGWVLCSDRAKNFMVERGYTNVAFLEVGEAG